MCTCYRGADLFSNPDQWGDQILKSLCARSFAALFVQCITIEHYSTYFALLCALTRGTSVCVWSELAVNLNIDPTGEQLVWYAVVARHVVEETSNSFIRAEGSNCC